MVHISPASPRNGRGRHAAVAAACAAAAALLAGCGAASSGGSAGPAKPLSPRQAITLAYGTTSRATSVTGDFTIHAGTSTGEGLTGTMSERLKPTLLLAEDLSLSAAGQKVAISEILSAQAIYLKEAAMSAESGKPWVEIPLSSLSGGLGGVLTQLLQDIQNGNPLEQTQVLATAKDVRADGTQVVDGVQTTRYAGSISPAVALKALSPGLRTSLAPMLNLISGDITFTVWIDGQHQVRRLVESEMASGEPINVTMNITSVNQPVHITLPPASQVATMPKSDLGDL
jgi:hypothetical protein